MLWIFFILSVLGGGAGLGVFLVLWGGMRLSTLPLVLVLSGIWQFSFDLIMLVLVLRLRDLPLALTVIVPTSISIFLASRFDNRFLPYLLATGMPVALQASWSESYADDRVAEVTFVNH